MNYFFSAEDLQKNNLRTIIIPILSPEWSVQFKFKLLGEHVGADSWCNIVHVTKGSNNAAYGDRQPAIFFNKVKTVLQIFLIKLG